MVRQLVFLLRWCATATLLLLWGIVAPAEAGVVLIGNFLPAQIDQGSEQSDDLTQFLADLEAGLTEASSSSAAANTDERRSAPEYHADRSPTDNRPFDADQPSETICLPSTMSTQGSTSGTSSSSGTMGGTTNYPLGMSAVPVISDEDMVCWIAGERRTLVPMPPGNDLLRPPQA
jgi:hypothetical protein